MVDALEAITGNTLTGDSEGELKADLVPSLPKSHIAAHRHQFVEREILK